MAQIWVRKQNDLTQEVSLKCATLYWSDMYDHKSECQFSLIRNHKPTQTEQYHALGFEVNKPNFTVESVRWSVLGDDLTTADTLTDYPMGNVDIEKVDPYGTGNYMGVQWKDSAFTPMTVGVKPDDWDTMYFCKYFVRTTWGSNWDGYMYQALRKSATWSPTTQYYRSNKTYTMQYTVAGTGIIDFTFGARTILAGNSYYNMGSFAWSAPSDDPFRLLYADGIGNTNFALPGTSTDSTKNAVTFSFGGASSPLTYMGPYCYAVPVAFNIPAGTVIGSGSNEYTVPQNRQYYGTMFVVQDTLGNVSRIYVEALESLCWAAPTHPHQDYGEDSPSYGGKGQAAIGKDNPRKSINKAKVGGIITDPASGAGIVIYKMTESEFAHFIKSFADTSLEGWAKGSWAPDYINAMNLIPSLINYWSKDAGNILFIKTSPVSFPSTATKRLSSIRVGGSNVADLHNPFQVQIVTGWYKEGTADLNFTENSPLGTFTAVNDFTDLEPYTTSEFYFPTASSLTIPPSYLANATCSVDWGFNLLDSSTTVTYTLRPNLQGEGGYIQLASTGQCCANAETLIASKDTKEAVQSLTPLITKGLSTIATGGMTAAGLVTTAAGAAATAIPMAQQLEVVNLPTSGSSSPYNDCVVGGRRDCILTITKAKRFSSGEESSTAGRSDVMGKYSNFYINSLNELGDGNFFSVFEIKMDLQSGMTKAEYDKVIALLHEGVWL